MTITYRHLYRFVWIVSAIVIVAMCVTFLGQPPPAVAAKEWLAFVSSDKTISVEHPANWEPRETTSHAVETDVDFVPQQGARIVFRILLQDSLIADTALVGNVPGAESMPGMPAPSRLSPLEIAHKLQHSRMSKQTKDYASLEDGATEKIKIADLDALATPFRCKRQIGMSLTEMTGKRITAIAGSRSLSVVYVCPADSATELNPIFSRMLMSLQAKEPGS